MDIAELKKLIKEIVQSEIEPSPRGGGIQASQKGMGIWHDDKPFYHTKKVEGKDLWHTEESKETEEPAETKQTQTNFPGTSGGDGGRSSGQAKFDTKS